MDAVDETIDDLQGTHLVRFWRSWRERGFSQSSFKALGDLMTDKGLDFHDAKHSEALIQALQERRVPYPYTIFQYNDLDSIAMVLRRGFQCIVHAATQKYYTNVPSYPIAQTSFVLHGSASFPVKREVKLPILCLFESQNMSAMKDKFLLRDMARLFTEHIAITLPRSMAPATLKKCLGYEKYLPPRDPESRHASKKKTAFTMSDDELLLDATAPSHEQAAFAAYDTMKTYKQLSMEGLWWICGPGCFYAFRRYHEHQASARLRLAALQKELHYRFKETRPPTPLVYKLLVESLPHETGRILNANTETGELFFGAMAVPSLREFYGMSLDARVHDAHADMQSVLNRLRQNLAASPCGGGHDVPGKLAYHPVAAAPCCMPDEILQGLPLMDAVWYRVPLCFGTLQDVPTLLRELKAVLRLAAACLVPHGACVMEAVAQGPFLEAMRHFVFDDALLKFTKDLGLELQGTWMLRNHYSTTQTQLRWSGSTKTQEHMQKRGHNACYHPMFYWTRTMSKQ